MKLRIIISLYEVHLLLVVKPYSFQRIKME